MDMHSKNKGIRTQFGRWLLIALLATLSVAAHSIERITYYHNDHLGSPVAATDTQGNVVWRESYQPYGTRQQHQGDSQNKVWYTGKQEEATYGVSYFGARWYDPEMGRFLTMDPVGVSPKNFNSFNRYAYANNNPYRFVDPDGRDAIVTFKKDGSISVEIPIKFLGRAVSAANVNKIKNDINGLSGTYTINGKETNVTFAVTEPKPSSEGGKANFIDLSPGATSRKSCDGCSFVRGGQFGEWNMSEINNHSGVAGHEAVHLVGGKDHYTEKYNDNGIRISTTPEKTFENNLMGDLNGRLDDRNFQEMFSSNKNSITHEK